MCSPLLRYATTLSLIVPIVPPHGSDALNHPETGAIVAPVRTDTEDDRIFQFRLNRLTVLRLAFPPDLLDGPLLT